MNKTIIAIGFMILIALVIFTLIYYIQPISISKQCLDKFTNECNQMNGSLGIENAILIGKCDSQIYCYSNYSSKFLNPCQC